MWGRGVGGTGGVSGACPGDGALRRRGVGGWLSAVPGGDARWPYGCPSSAAVAAWVCVLRPSTYLSHRPDYCSSGHPGNSELPEQPVLGLVSSGLTLEAGDNSMNSSRAWPSPTKEGSRARAASLAACSACVLPHQSPQ